jgi:heme a synthase
MSRQPEGGARGDSAVAPALAGRLPRARRLAASPALFLKVAVASTVSLYAIIVSGATVRLTGSGLGCDAWPGCEEGSFFPARDHHAFVEFGNRAVAIFPLTLTLVCWLVARRTPGLPRWVKWVALATFVGTLAQAPLGRLTIVLDLHPLMVMTHFLLSLVVLGGAVVVTIEGWSNVRGRGEPPLGRTGLRGAFALGALCAALLLSGALATAAGPHSGGEDIARFGNLIDAMELHVRAAAVFGVAFVVLVAWLYRSRARAPRLFGAAVAVLAVLGVQAAVGELQWRSELPWGLVLVHVALAAAVWAGTVALVAALVRPPAPLAPPRPT